MTGLRCKWLGTHDFHEFQNVHHVKVDEGHWSATIIERGRECVRCGLRKIELEHKK